MTIVVAGGPNGGRSVAATGRVPVGPGTDTVSTGASVRCSPAARTATIVNVALRLNPPMTMRDAIALDPPRRGETLSPAGAAEPPGPVGARSVILVVLGLVVLELVVLGLVVLELVLGAAVRPPDGRGGSGGRRGRGGEGGP
jgi:hypothetical protein